jgi:tetratricopeptide (TPR) repeat protein
MTFSATTDKQLATAEARRLAELARAAGFGDSPDDALQLHRDAASLIGSDEPTPLLADVLRWQATVLCDRGRTSEAEPLYQRSLDVANEIGYDAGRAHATNYLASLALRRGDLAAAIDLLTRALDLADRCGEARLVGMLQQNLGIAADIRGNPSAAIAHYRVSLRTFQQTNDLQPLCWVLNNLGLVLLREEEYNEAGDCFVRALSIARTRGDLMSEVIIEENRAELLMITDAIDEAYASLARAKEIAELRGDDLRLAAALRLRGTHERLSGRPGDATDTLRYALTLSAITEDALLGAETLFQFGMALDEFGDAKAARSALESALEAFQRIGAWRWVARVRTRLSGGATGRYW